MNPMKRTGILGALAVAGGVGIAACGTSSSEKAAHLEAQQQGQSSQSLNLSQPLPHFNYSQLRQNLKEIETAQAKGVETTTFFFNLGEQEPIQSCPSIGAPIASTTELSNPQRIGENWTVLPQQDPTGVFTGDSTGTYVMCVNSNGEAYADYWEGYVQTVFGAATWSASKHQVVLVGTPSIHFTK